MPSMTADAGRRFGGLLEASAMPLEDRFILLLSPTAGVEMDSFDFFAVCVVGELDRWGVKES